MTDLHAGGLSSAEAAERLAKHGPNALPAAKPRGALVRFLAQFDNPLIWFLLAAALAAAALGHRIDAAVIAAVVLLNALVGFIQEGKAERALDAIRRMIAPRAAVIRDGVRASVPVEALVPGDVVLLEAGDRVPADLRLVHARGLLLDEAVLTGESVPVAKEEQGSAFSGTLVAAGQGRGLVVATGAASEIGRISGLLESVEPLATPLVAQMKRFAARFTIFAIVGAAALFAFAVLVRDYAWPQALIAVVALAVSLVPEGLPAVISITLAIGVRRMAARNAVIRRLPAVETLGATSVICSDKTGTLTRNEMTVRHVAGGGHRAQVSGAGYAPRGEIEALDHDDDAACLAAVLPLVRCGLLCNDARLHQAEGAWVVEGDPMEGALLALAMKAGLNPRHVRAEWPRLDEVPFDAAYRFMATLHRAPGGATRLFVKGAPEKLLELSPAADREYWEARIAEAASAGERVLGFATRDVSTLEVRELEFLGIAGFIDPPRPEAIAALEQCRSAGIEVMMITGDHALTAAAIGRQLGLPAEAVHARATPEDKIRLVRELQARRAVVAMTGDGVNDAPALRQADVGVAMGIKGTEAAKQAAEMVLLDDNFASIVAAVHEGRTVHDNIRKVVAWTLPTNGGEALTVVIALAFGLVLPLSAVQILWINLVADVALGLALAFEPSEPGVMQRPPRRRDEPLLSPFLLRRVIVVAALFAAISLGVFFAAQAMGRDLETARTLVANTLVVLQIAYLFNVRYLHVRSISWRGALGTPALLWALAAVACAQLAFTYAPFMQQWFDTRPVALADALLVLACGAGFMLLLEAEKKWVPAFAGTSSSGPR